MEQYKVFQTTNQLLFGSRLQERKHQWTQKIDHADFLTINLGASVPPPHSTWVIIVFSVNLAITNV